LLKRTAALARRVVVFNVVAIDLTLALGRDWTLVGSVLGGLEYG
jgi:hypothetical protein